MPCTQCLVSIGLHPEDTPGLKRKIQGNSAMDGQEVPK